MYLDVEGAVPYAVGGGGSEGGPGPACVAYVFCHYLPTVHIKPFGPNPSHSATATISDLV